MATKFKNLKSMGVAAFLSVASLVGAPATLGFEGMKLKPYYDSVGIKTWCVGETEMGYKEKFTPKECGALYKVRYGWYSVRTLNMYNDKAASVVTPEVHAALTDMSYNIGVNAVQRSSMIAQINMGNAKGACNAILLYKKAGGYDCSKPGNKVCWGVWDRRVKMNKLCLRGIL